MTLAAAVDAVVEANKAEIVVRGRWAPQSSLLKKTRDTRLRSHTRTVQVLTGERSAITSLDRLALVVLASPFLLWEEENVVDRDARRRPSQAAFAPSDMPKYQK